MDINKELNIIDSVGDTVKDNNRGDTVGVSVGVSVDTVGVTVGRKRNNFIKKSGLDAIQKNVAYEIALGTFTGKSYGDIAKEYNVNRSTIWRWKTFKEFNEEINKYTLEIQKSQITDAVKQLHNILLHGKDKDKLKAIEIIYKNNGLLKEVTENTTVIKEDININNVLDELLL